MCKWPFMAAVDTQRCVCVAPMEGDRPFCSSQDGFKVLSLSPRWVQKCGHNIYKPLRKVLISMAMRQVFICSKSTCSHVVLQLWSFS